MSFWVKAAILVVAYVAVAIACGAFIFWGSTSHDHQEPL